uniref:Uncharacterized protein n=1 Tax=Myoviridae sp. ct2cn10 TaxID=2825022 RepID=A0A8S5PCJ5_9CAUD|nr:MAG TPA: hypothetical protein [Myoviridae sp. ct2cn10]
MCFSPKEHPTFVRCPYRIHFRIKGFIIGSIYLMNV